MPDDFTLKNLTEVEDGVVLSGSGRVKIGDDVVDIGVRDAIRIAPGVARGWEAGPDGLELLAFGPQVEDDAEVVDDFWPQ